MIYENSILRERSDGVLVIHGMIRVWRENHGINLKRHSRYEEHLKRVLADLIRY